MHQADLLPDDPSMCLNGPLCKQSIRTLRAAKMPQTVIEMFEIIRGVVRNNSVAGPATVFLRPSSIPNHVKRDKNY